MASFAKLLPMVAIGSLSLLLGCSPSRTPVEEIGASPSVSVASASTYEPPVEDWPWWRGPQSNGISPSATAPVKFSETENVIWKTDLPGRGHSSPTVSGQHVLLASANEAKQQQMVVALDRESGKQLWSTVVSEGGFPDDRQMHNKSTHANGTIAVNGSAMFIAFLHHDAITAYCLNYQGEVLWEQKLGAFNAKFGYAPSPTIYKSLVIFAADNHGGGYLAAVDQATGEIVWRKSRDAVSSYSTPVVANVAGTDQLIISGGEQVVSFDPLTGEENWACPGTAEATCGTVVWSGDHVFASGGYPERETVCIHAASGERVWSNSVKCYEQSMLIVDDYLYALSDDGIAFCWEALTGKEQWKKRLGGPVSASPVFCGGNIYAASERGTFYVFQANPDSFKLVAENTLGDQSFASPVICGQRLYIRVGFDSKPAALYCFGDSKSGT